ncbi:MAG TPA: aminotransferase class IV [Polyangiaceae bacterium]|nr:aminotransferase class IV [Polyangiaceae bacterium]
MHGDEIEVYIDGRWARGDDARVSVFDRGFLYGDSVFETLRTYGGRAFALDEHMTRLADSARRVLIELPLEPGVLGEEVRQQLAETRQRRGYADCYVRTMVTRGRGALGLDPQNASEPLRVALIGPLQPPPEALYRDGIAVVSYAGARHTDASAAAGAKIGNYLVAVLAQDRARKAGAHEALIVDSEGGVIEGATSNLFWWDGEVLCTPPLEAGILAGITRAHLLGLARTEGREIRLAVPTLDELLRASEVFVSSSIRELLPVVRIDGRVVGTGVPGARTQALHASFRRHALAAVGA